MAAGSAALAPMITTGRIERLRALLGQQGTPEGLIITNLVNIRWLTGFTGSAATMVVTKDDAVLATDGRYRTQAAEQVAKAGVEDLVRIVIGGVAEQREAITAATGRSREVGLEASDVSWAAQQRWSELLDHVSLRPTDGLVEGLRLRKDAGEIARMARAAAIADQGLADVIGLLSEVTADSSLSETEFAAALDHAMRRRGAEDRAFETIVASGSNAAKPHHRPGDRVIRPGETVVVDFGATFDGYRSDMTRTFVPKGGLGQELTQVLATVLAAQAAGVARVAPGVATGEIDETCRALIRDAGWGERFEHGTGHGVGLDIHEAPSVGPGSTAILEAGCVVTVEPGIYLPGLGGVRIEDTLVVTEDGRRSLTQYPKDVAV